MKVFNAIMGVFAIFASLYCFFWPGHSFLTAGAIIMVLLGVLGACAIFEAVRQFGERKQLNMLVRGLLAFLAGLAIAVVLMVSMFTPVPRALLDLIVVYIFTFWLIISGVSSIVSAVAVKKKLGGSLWVLSLIMGILTLIVGIYGCFHILLMAQTIGVLLGVFLMFYGVRLLVTLAEKES